MLFEIGETFYGCCEVLDTEKVFFCEGNAEVVLLFCLDCAEECFCVFLFRNSWRVITVAFPEVFKQRVDDGYEFVDGADGLDDKDVSGKACFKLLPCLF